MNTHIIGFPRFGAGRELKKALEAFWKDSATEEQLLECCTTLRHKHWAIQQQAGLSYVAVGDFSMYDHMLDLSITLGAVPERFRHLDYKGLELYFKMARGDQSTNIPAMEMTKWFNTNYHFIVPEMDAGINLHYADSKLVDEVKEAIAAGFNPKPVLIGPITYLSLSKGVDSYDCWNKLDELVAVYCQLITELAPLCEWIEFDEPILSSDMPERGRAAFREVYAKLNQTAADGKTKILLATYFDSLDDNLDLAISSACAGLHLDLVRGDGNLDDVLKVMPQDMLLSCGIVEGRNVWKNDFAESLETLRKVSARKKDRMMVASSCSLLHCPLDLNLETQMDGELKSWMAFAVQKCKEISILSDILEGVKHDSEFTENQAAVTSRHKSSRVHDPAVTTRMATLTPAMYHRNSAYPLRRQAQQWLGLPILPTTTIGSFPQTDEIRKKRADFKHGIIDEDEYKSFIQSEIAMVIQKQEELGLDVFVHGEPERNDMVEYFGQQLQGFCFTENGWVQSYGSRAVKPPIIFGDVSRPRPMTVDWIKYAQSLTCKPVKGMLTGPVTILCWSFVRDDMERAEVCKQVALAILDEVRDLEKAGIKIIQIDEAALSEGMPVKEKDRAGYLHWAVESFRLAVSGVEDSTQLHTHMCYSEFNRIIQSIADMDADVISIESSRSKMELLNAFRDFEYPNEIGPGVYDIHSPRIPSENEMLELLKKALRYIPAERLWVNPDCGLKTRNWKEVIPALANMVKAARRLRETL
jgi:5-methyltetrahydropteroyltriglutamate--homocysteine methyltransferase